MAEQFQDTATAFFSEQNTKIRDMEEKQRLLKERVLLIGQNLISAKDKLDEAIIELKSGVNEIKEEIEKIKAAVLRQSEELDNKAKRSELEILARQMKMFQPLEFARIEDVKQLLKNAGNK